MWTGHTTALFTFALTWCFEPETRTNVTPQKQLLKRDLPGRTGTNSPERQTYTLLLLLLSCYVDSQSSRSGIHLLSRLAAITDPEHEIHLTSLRMLAVQVPNHSCCSSESMELRRHGSFEQMQACTLGQEELHPKTTCFSPLAQESSQ